MKRILSAKSAVESSKLRSGNLMDEEFNKLNEAANELMASKLFVDDSSNIKVGEIFSKMCIRDSSDIMEDRNTCQYPGHTHSTPASNHDNHRNRGNTGTADDAVKGMRNSKENIKWS